MKHIIISVVLIIQLSTFLPNSNYKITQIDHSFPCRFLFTLLACFQGGSYIFPNVGKLEARLHQSEYISKDQKYHIGVGKKEKSTLSSCFLKESVSNSESEQV